MNPQSARPKHENDYKGHHLPLSIYAIQVIRELAPSATPAPSKVDPGRDKYFRQETIVPGYKIRALTEHDKR